MTLEEEPKKGKKFLFALGILLLLAALAYSGSMMLYTMGGTFRRGFLGHNGARYSIMARNVLRCDLSQANFAPLLNAAEETDPDPYLHHPPLLHWVIALVFAVCGENEDKARMVPYAFTILTLILIYLIGFRIMGSSLLGGISAVIAASLPMTNYYGAHIDVQSSPLTFCILACVLSYCCWMHSLKKGWYYLSILFLIVGTLFDWPALYLCLLIPLHQWISLKRSGQGFLTSFRETLPFILTGAVLFALLFIWLSTAAPSKGTTLFESLIHRTLKPTTFLDIGDHKEYALNCLKDYTLPSVHALYPWPFWVLIFLGWILRFFEPARSQRRFMGTATFWLFFLLGACHVVMFPFGTLFHDYWVFLFMPWIAFSATLALDRLAGFLKQKRIFGKTMGISITALVLCATVLLGNIYLNKRLSQKADLDMSTWLLASWIRITAKPGEAVMTNADFYNAPVPGINEDKYILHKPALAYYADRVIRGNIKTPLEFEDVLKRRNDFAFFLFYGFMPNRINEEELLHYLQERYHVIKRYKEMFFFNLKKKKEISPSSQSQ